MKCYRFRFDISYGERQGIIFAKNERTARDLLEGQGIIFAKNERTARDLLKSENPYGLLEQDINKVELFEIETKITQLIDFSWSE